jgi:hypothetical protein
MVKEANTLRNIGRGPSFVGHRCSSSTSASASPLPCEEGGRWWRSTMDISILCSSLISIVPSRERELFQRESESYGTPLLFYEVMGNKRCVSLGNY